jgi:hypothetical protein
MQLAGLAARPLQISVEKWALIAVAGFSVGVTGASFENLLKALYKRTPSVRLLCFQPTCLSYWNPVAVILRGLTPVEPRFSLVFGLFMHCPEEALGRGALFHLLRVWVAAVRILCRPRCRIWGRCVAHVQGVQGCEARSLHCLRWEGDYRSEEAKNF